MADFDLDAYLRRIGHAGSRAPTLATLGAVHAAHVGALAFENLDPLLGRPVALDLGALQRKLVAGGRGGWCYEHNRLLGAALRTLGFAVTDLAARVRLNVPEGVQRPRTHMLLAVDLDGQRHLVDGGFGGHTLTAPIRLAPDAEQATPHGRFRLLREGAGHALLAEAAGTWRTLYSFDETEHLPADFEMASWYLCHHPESIFRHTLMAARVRPGLRLALRDNRLSSYAADGSAQVRMLTSATALRAVLEGDFGLALDGLAGLDAVLARVATGTGVTLT